MSRFDDDFDDDPPDEDRPLAMAPHSSLGIASFVLGMIAGVSMMMSILIAIMVGINRPPGAAQPHEPELMIIGLVIIGSGILSLVGTGLGLAGVLQSDRRVVFAILGLIINLLLAMSFCGVIGLAAATG